MCQRRVETVYVLTFSFQAISSTNVAIRIYNSDYCSGKNTVKLTGNMHCLYSQPEQVCCQSKNYNTLKLLQSAIQIFNQPRQCWFCTVAYGLTWNTYKGVQVCVCVCVSTLLCAYVIFMTTVDVVILYVVDGQLESSAERNNRIFGLFVRNGDIRMFSSQ